MFAETTKGKRAVIHQGYLYQKIRDNGPKSWCMDNDIVINVSGIHLGYQTEYLHNDQIRVFIREMMALAFIPGWEVSIAF